MRLFVPLTRGEFEALVALARTERRRPQDQAAAMLAALLAPATDASVDPSVSAASPTPVLPQDVADDAAA